MGNQARVMFSTLVALATLVAACGPAATPTAEAPSPTQPSSATSIPIEEPTEVTPSEVEPADEEPITLRVGGVKDTDCWNPWACAQIYYFLGNYVNEPILSSGKDYACSGMPLLAKSIDMSEDGKTHTFHLQEGVTFSDGTPFDAHAFVDYLDWVSSTDAVYWFSFTLNMTSYEALDDLTVEVTTEIPMISFQRGNAFWFYIYAPHIWGDVGNDELYDFENYPPIGTGPFTVADWSPGEYIIYDAYEDYWGGKPPIDRIVFQEYSNNDAMVQAFLAGELDVINNDPPIPPVYYDTLVEAEYTTVIDYPPGPTHFMVFNLAEGGTKNPAVDDVEVRRAIDLAIDKQYLVDVALLGHGITCANGWTCGPAFEEKLNPALEITPFDPEKAKSMLDEAGYSDSDGDGVREGPDGTPMNLRLFYPQESVIYITTAETIRDWLADVGIGVDVTAMEFATQWDLVLAERDFDMAIFGFTPDFEPVTMDFYYSCWSAEGGGWNYAGYCKPEMEELIYQMQNASTEEELQSASFLAQKLLYDDLPRIMLFGQNNMQVFHNDRFEFDTDICYSLQGVWDPQNLMNLKVK